MISGEISPTITISKIFGVKPDTRVFWARYNGGVIVTTNNFLNYPTLVIIFLNTIKSKTSR